MSAFGNYVTSTAFQLRLSKPQITTLIQIAGKWFPGKKANQRDEHRVQIRYISYRDVGDLSRKGLIHIDQGDWYSLSVEGQLIANLLICADLAQPQEIYGGTKNMAGNVWADYNRNLGVAA